MPDHNSNKPFHSPERFVSSFREFSLWGGYFASNQYRSVLDSGWVDAIVNGPGDEAFPALLEAVETNRPFDTIHNFNISAGRKNHQDAPCPH